MNCHGRTKIVCFSFVFCSPNAWVESLRFIMVEKGTDCAMRQTEWLVLSEQQFMFFCRLKEARIRALNTQTWHGNIYLGRRQLLPNHLSLVVCLEVWNSGNNLRNLMARDGLGKLQILWILRNLLRSGGVVKVWETNSIGGLNCTLG